MKQQDLDVAVLGYIYLDYKKHIIPIIAVPLADGTYNIMRDGVIDQESVDLQAVIDAALFLAPGQLGRKGGSKTSKAKAAASRRNGKKGGYPGKKLP